MHQDDLGQYVQQQYELIKGYLVCASLGIAVLITALYVAATVLWRKLKDRRESDFCYHKPAEPLKVCPKPSMEGAVLIQTEEPQNLRMSGANAGHQA
jgi:hypothetical protein